MARQDKLEQLADPETTPETMQANRGVISFIDEFLYETKANLDFRASQLERQKRGLPDLSAPPEGDPYMELSPDPNDPQGA